MSGASSLAGGKRERVPTSPTLKGGTDPSPALVSIARLAAACEICNRLGPQPYRRGLEQLAMGLERIFEARLVVLRDGGPGEPVGVAPAGCDALEWLERLERLGPPAAASSARSFSVANRESFPAASKIEQVVVVPLEESVGRGALWMGFADHLVPSSEELRCLELVGRSVASALRRLASQGPEQAVVMTADGAGEATSNFISLAAHELRTPLTPITMLLQTLERKARIGTVDLDAIVRTRKQVHRLAQMISDLLDLTRLREDRLTLTPVLVELGSALAQAVSSFAENDAGRQMELTTPDEATVIRADETRLVRSLTSLIEHVARVTSADDGIRVELACRGNQATIAVTAERHTPRPPASLEPLGSGRPYPLAISVLLAQAILARFRGAVSIGDQGGEHARLEVTLPLVDSSGA